MNERINVQPHQQLHQSALLLDARLPCKTALIANRHRFSSIFVLATHGSASLNPCDGAASVMEQCADSLADTQALIQNKHRVAC